ncbi:hypothetical protein HYG81_19820 (plasmid) [Natrinema zhouii]|uniref:hypothetical protein n=1 Tax=Natrinema zhouii TaxID=1710539 RepID=UPI001D0010D1|nr:hypothetical protein [Natrinema zhouii]UHQ98321.1 hypothetical protein HYG81_19820 [Natrinema zhouii]
MDDPITTEPHWPFSLFRPAAIPLCLSGRHFEVLSRRLNAERELSNLKDLTAKLTAGDYEDRNRFRSEIMRSAHSLAGLIIHLFDALEIDIVRELRVPSGLETDSLDELATSISISAAIQGKYGVFASY